MTASTALDVQFAVPRPDARAAAVLGCLAVMAVAAVLLFARLGDVRAPVWDEAYYLTSTARYHEGRAQFASHPPLGLMLIAAGDGLYGGNRGIDESAVAAVKSVRAEDMPAGYDYAGPRVAPALFGVIGAGLFFLLMLELTGSASAALMLSPLYLCDTALLAQFRAAQLDAFQVAFALAAILAAVRCLRHPRIGWAFAIGLAVGLASLVKANGILIGVIGLFPVVAVLRKRSAGPAARLAVAGAGGAVVALALTVMAYVSVSQRMPDPATPAGTTDFAFVSPAHRVALESGEWSASALAAMLADQVRFIRSDFAGMPAGDANGSSPLGWIVGQGAIAYSWSAGADGFSSVALIANRAAWLVSLAGLLAGALALRRGFDPLRAMLLTGWAVSFLALLWLSQQRVLYLYCYFVPLMFGHALAALEWRRRALSKGMHLMAMRSWLG